MKLFVSLLFTAVLFTPPPRALKITAYRFIEQHCDGPYYIALCVNSEGYKEDIAKTACADVVMASKLIAFKAQVTKGVSTPFYCSEKWIGGDIVDAFIVLSGRTNDTLFFSHKRSLLVVPSQNRAFSYKNQEFLKLLNPGMRSFFAHDFEGERRKLQNPER